MGFIVFIYTLFMILFKYSIFAIIATSLNLLFQFFTLVIYDGLWSFYFAMIIGTIVGLICKYFFDKNYIFNFKNEVSTSEFKIFFLYSLTGVITTAIFWGFEISFHRIFEFKSAKYIGAIIGLGIGYVFKFFLDRKFF
ncbi:GtrA family protein [Candidatus Pseudothioglobus singularis]